VANLTHTTSFCVTEDDRRLIGEAAKQDERRVGEYLRRVVIADLTARGLRPEETETERKAA